MNEKNGLNTIEAMAPAISGGFNYGDAGEPAFTYDGVLGPEQVGGFFS